MLTPVADQHLSHGPGRGPKPGPCPSLFVHENEANSLRIVASDQLDHELDHGDGEDKDQDQSQEKSRSTTLINI